MKKYIPRSVTLFLMFLGTVSVAPAQTIFPGVERAGALHSIEPLRAAQTAAVYRPLETLHLTRQDLEWINETRTRRVYQSGLLTMQYQDVWEGDVFGEWQEFNRIDYAYSGGILSRMTTYERSEAGWVGLTRLSYTIENGVYTQVVTENYTGASWEFEERSSFTRSNGLITEGLTETWTGGAWTPSERFTFVEEDEDIVETYQGWDGTTWGNTERFLYPDLTLVILNHLLEQLINDFNDYEGLYYGLRFPDALEQEWDGSAWVNVVRQTTVRVFYPINSTLLQETITTEEWDGDDWVSTYRLDVEYTQMTGVEGLPAKTSFQVYDGQEWMDLFVETYILQNNVRRVAQATIQADLGEGLQEISQIRIDWKDIASSTEPIETPRAFELGPNFPNPFNPTTRIAFRLSVPQHVRLSVYDLLGREVAVLEDGLRPAGDHTLLWEAAGMPSGVYLYRLEAGAQSQTRQMVLLK